MKTSVKTELANHLLNLINDGVLTNENKNEWQHLAFNEDYYLIGYYNCSEWLKKHNLDTYEAIAICQDYEIEMFGEFQTRYDNAEITVNMLAYFYGEELINEFEGETIKGLKEFCLSI
tara:strand:+ start:82 stop:435 length:354 start_codon:yes stop_codon:yes gene_type:complete